MDDRSEVRRNERSKRGKRRVEEEENQRDGQRMLQSEQSEAGQSIVLRYLDILRRVDLALFEMSNDVDPPNDESGNIRE